MEVPSNLTKEERVLRARKVLREAALRRMQQDAVRRAERLREIEELRSKYDANPPEDPHFRQTLKRLREIGESRSKYIANPELKQRFLSQQDPRVRERQERIWDAFVLKLTRLKRVSTGLERVVYQTKMPREDAYVFRGKYLRVY